MAIKYLLGDATSPIGIENKIIAHVCNDQGGWGRGFVTAISRRWKLPEQQYRALDAYILGTVIYPQVNQNTWVANMIAQHGYTKPGKPAIDYHYLAVCLRDVASYAATINASIHMPRIGCGLAGGKWEVVEKLIQQEMGNLQVYVYDMKR